MFEGSVAFMMGNEGAGMNPAQLEACDRYVYIPQYGGGTASLNVANATGVVMHKWFTQRAAAATTASVGAP